MHQVQRLHATATRLCLAVHLSHSQQLLYAVASINPKLSQTSLTIPQEEASPCPVRQPQLMACTGQAHRLELQGRDGSSWWV
jgi:hypothetical protein